VAFAGRRALHPVAIQVAHLSERGKTIMVYHEFYAKKINIGLSIGANPLYKKGVGSVF
jgi:hypothetical protein